MQQILLMIVVVALVGCASGSKKKNQTSPAAPMSTSWVSDPTDANNVKIEAGIREELKKPTGKLTKADLEKVTGLEIRGRGLTDVKSLEKLTQLKTLYLSNNKLTEVPMELENLTQLKTLDLRSNKLTDVKGLEKLNQLTKLGLYGNKLTEVKGLEKLTKLTELDLITNKLTDVKGLEKLTKLTWLGLRYNPDLTNVQIAELQKALPKCDIYSNSSELTNLTVSSQARDANGLYRVEIIWENNANGVRHEPVVLVGTKKFSMTRAELVSDRWETLLPVAADATSVTYRIRVDWQSNAIPVPPANSKMSGAFQLIIQDK